MNLFTAFTSLFCLVALCIWFFYRKKFKRVLLHTIRIIPDPKKNLPRVKLAKPPLVGFLSMFFSVCSLIFLTTFPDVYRNDPSNQNKPKVHLFLDLSPSVFAHLDSDQYALAVGSAVRSLISSSRISLSFSDSAVITELSDINELDKILKKIKVHRFGTQIGAALKNTMSKDSDLAGLVIFSDKDLFSWEDLNWKAHPYSIFRVDLSSKKPLQNYFIQDVKAVSSNKQNIQTYDVAIGRSSTQATSLLPASGILNVWLQNKLLQETKWNFAKDEKQVNLIVGLNFKDNLRSGAFLRWEIRPTNSADSISEDNEFRTSLASQLLQATLIADQTQEFATFDAQRFLVSTLRALGAHIKRVEKLELAMAFQDYGFLILQISPLDAQEQCSYLQTSSIPVWIMPRFDATTQNICDCLTGFLKSHKFSCKTEEDIVATISENSQVISHDPKEGFIEFVAENHRASSTLFFAPLSPLMASTAKHSDFIKFLRKRFDVTRGELKLKNQHPESWPRYESYNFQSNVSEADSALFSQSNVPLKESLMLNSDAAELPPLFNEKKFLQNLDNSEFGRTRDPLPMIKLVGLCIVLFLFAESLLLIFPTLVRKITAKKLVYLFVVGAFGFEPMLAHAGVQVTVLTQEKFDIGFEQVGRDLSQRTSVDLNPKPSIITQFRPDLIAEPIVFITSPQFLFNPQKLDGEFLRWLKRGGFFLGFFNSEKLEAGLKDAGFKVGIFAQDHELMRSFYLLNRLPTCGQGTWRSIEIDQRLVGIEAPTIFLTALNDKNTKPLECAGKISKEELTRVFINVLMVVLATDYKKDQIHLPEILKRLK